MKKLYICFLIISILFLVSCSEKVNETHFVHCACFEERGESIRLCAVLEKLNDEKKDFFSVSVSGSSLNSAAEKLMKQYGGCYFATCDLYFISSSANDGFLDKIAKELCDSNIFPTTSKILCLKDTEGVEFFKHLKNMQDIEKIKKRAGKNKTNCVKFFSDFYSGKEVSPETFYIDGSEIEKSDKTAFSKQQKGKT